jgi:S1-C subfamily serine protease
MRKVVVGSLVGVASLAVAAGAIFAQDTAATSAWLGVRIAEVESQVIVQRVQNGSPADDANLEIGDVIVSFNGEAVDSAAELGELVAAAAVGDSVTLEVLRDEETVTADVTLEAQPARGAGFGGRGFAADADPLTIAERLLHADVTEADGVYTVTNVLDNRNPLAVEIGDVITSINGVAIADLTVDALIPDVAAGVDPAAPPEVPTLTIIVDRAGEEVTLTADGFFGGFGGRGEGRGPGGFGGGRGGRGGRGGDGFPGGQPDGSALPDDVAPPAEGGSV